MKPHPLIRVLAEARPLRRRLLVAVLLGALAIGAGVALMATSGYLISRAALRPPILSLAVAIVGVRFFGISKAVFRYLERLASHDAALRLLGSLRATFFARLEPLVPDDLPGGTRSGDLLSRFVADVDALQHLFVRALGPPAVAVLVAGGAALAAALVDPAAGLALAVALLLGGVAVPALSARLIVAGGRREAGARAALYTDVLELLEHGPELVVSGRVTDALADVATVDARLACTRRRSALVEGLGEGLITLVGGGALLAVLLVSVPAVRDGAVDGVMLGMLALLALASLDAIRPLPVAAQHLGATEASARRLYEVADLTPSVLDPKAPLPPPEGHELRLEAATIHRPVAGPPILDSVDLVLRAGTAVALVGPSGAGKTSLAHLLVRFRDPDEGSVLLDGHDLAEYRQEDVRRVVLYSGQDAHVFASSIRENLRIARPGAGDAELREALTRAGALDWVDGLPDGLDTRVGEQGRLVSGGQRQRLAVARAFLSAARFVVLDEPTAHLDDLTAAGLVDAILALAREGRGVLLITHGALGLADVSEVVRLERGRRA